MNKTKCEYCMYMLIVAGYLILLSFIGQDIDRLYVRDIMGTITSIASLVGLSLCIYAAKLLSHGYSELNNKLKHVYVMTALIMVCTAAMGIAGIIHPDPKIWDIIYNIRALSIVLEVVAFARFVRVWVKYGKE